VKKNPGQNFGGKNSSSAKPFFFQVTSLEEIATLGIHFDLILGHWILEQKEKSQANIPLLYRGYTRWYPSGSPYALQQAEESPPSPSKQQCICEHKAATRI
jgi:hypothetical protein